MKIRQGALASVRAQRPTSQQLISYLSYALEDLSVVSPRSARMLAYVIATLSREAHSNQSSPDEANEHDRLFH
jgi:hypothetical protein